MKVGYVVGFIFNLIYKEVCLGLIGYNEVVRVVYDINNINYVSLL